MNRTISGGCACGGIRYQFEGDVEFAFQCHCRKCQRATGTGHAAAFAVDRRTVELQGEVRFYEAPADNGAPTYSGFCPTCGSPMLSKSSRFPDRLYFHAATLDDPTTFDPRFVVYEESAQPWDPIPQALSRSGN